MKKIDEFIVLLLVSMFILVNPINSLAKPVSDSSNNANAKSIKAEKVVRENEINKNKESVRKELKKSIQELRETAKKAYTDEELSDLQNTVNEIKANYPGIKTIPVENIISRRLNMKFDTPPVIKEGRTLIPVRALTQAFGAQVNWNPDEKQVTIVKDDVEIVLQIDSNITYVNGEEVKIDVPAEIMNSRTIVPLRFIVEHMGLKLDWDEETETIEIIDEEDEAIDDANINDEENIMNEEGQVVEEQQTNGVGSEETNSQINETGDGTSPEINEIQ